MTGSPAILVVVAAALIGLAVVIMRLLIAGGVTDLANAHSLRDASLVGLPVLPERPSKSRS
jgi:hypothetical protein